MAWTGKMPPPPADPAPRLAPAFLPVPRPPFDRHEAEYRLRRRLMSAYAGAPVNHPDPAQRCGRLGVMAVDALVSAVVDEVESMFAGRPPVEPRAVEDDEYLPCDVPLFPRSQP